MKIAINEVAPRDGLQGEPRHIATEDKIAFVDALSALPFARIEVTSFTSPKAIPALSDASEVMTGIARNANTIYTALVPNLRGMERGIEAGVDEFNLVMSASETHNLTNLRMTRSQSLNQLAAMCSSATQENKPVNISLSCAFGCPMEGEVSASDVMDLVARFVDFGVSGITLCDTTGMAYPNQVGDLFSSCLARYASPVFTAHFHNTRGLALANIVAAIEGGIRSFDSALGGIGGCPYAPGATGNVATEDVVHMLECMGHETGISVEGLNSIANWLHPRLQFGIQSHVYKAGPRSKRHPLPDDFEQTKARALGRSL